MQGTGKVLVYWFALHIYNRVSFCSNSNVTEAKFFRIKNVNEPWLEEYLKVDNQTACNIFVSQSVLDYL